MRRVLLGLLALFITTGFFYGCGSANQPVDSAKGKMNVYTSFYPLYDFAKQIGGDKITVRNLVPPGAEPHDWEPTPQDVAEISKADILIISGNGVEPWANKVLGVVDQTKVKVIKSSEGIELMAGEVEGQPGAGTDPHIWLDPVYAKKMVNNILAGMVKADEKNKTYYEANAANFLKELDKLHNEYQVGLAQIQTKDFVTSHAAFGYLARRYGLTQIPVRGFSPESEPSPGDMVAVVKLARERHIKYIFFESLVSPKVTQAIAYEVQANTLVLNPLEGLTNEEMTAGKDYLSVMRDNLKNLKIALGAK